MDDQFNFTIIGAGIVGLAIAERLSRTYDKILLIDKEKTFGQHTSSRNSEVVHSGFYYPADSLKRKLCVKGNRMLYDFCNKYHIPYKKCGKLIVANTLSEEKSLNKLLIQANTNGVKNAKILSGNDARIIEPNVRCSKALWIPSTGIVDSHKVMSKLEFLSLSRDVSIIYNLEVENIQYNYSYYNISFKNDSSNIKSKYVINSAGLYSYLLANKVLNKNKYKIEFYKGDYFKTTEIKNLNTLIYPIPSDLSLGIHVVINLNGEVLFGPNAYKVDNLDYITTDEYKELFLEEANKLLAVPIKTIHADYSGIRPKLKFKGEMNDFIIKEETSLKGFYNLIGIDSPGLTSSLSIADYVYRKINY